MNTSGPLISLLIALVAGAVLFGLFRPRLGWFWRLMASREVNKRVRREDALKHLHESEYEGRQATLQTLAGVLGISPGDAAELVSELITRGYARPEGSSYMLTNEGRSYALQVIRAHRLWERYLADETDVGEQDIHARAEKVEHQLTVEEIDELEAQLGYPRFDPHGDPIPTADGQVAEKDGMPLTRWPLDRPGRIVHLEDEPPEVYAQLLAEGLRLGEDVRVMGRSHGEVRFFTEEKEYVVASVVAANITIASLPEESRIEGPYERLAHLQGGHKGTVKGLDENCRGLSRRRLLDLGFTPGAEVEVDMEGPFGDPRAYRIRGTLIALRMEQAEMVLLEPFPEKTGEESGDDEE